MKLKHIADTLLDEASPPTRLRAALNAFVQLCTEIGGVVPDRSFDAWAGDSLLKDGVAISPEAAAHCVHDTQRSVVFIRAAFAAIKAAQKRFTNGPIDILYAGCGPFATILLPLLGRFNPDELTVHLLDIHQRSLDSVALIIKHCGLQTHRISYLQDDACNYQHPSNPHVIIAETMQKSLEQEPQFAVTANLAPQLQARGIFIPQKVEVALCLAKLDDETAAFRRGDTLDPNALVEAGNRYPLTTVLCLTPEDAQRLQQQASQTDHGFLELSPVHVTIPATAHLEDFDAVLLTRIQAFEQHRLLDYEAEITLPLRCNELMPLHAGDRYRISLQIGRYPKFSVTRIRDD
jgi:hypothetical protein